MRAASLARRCGWSWAEAAGPTRVASRARNDRQVGWHSARHSGRVVHACPRHLHNETHMFRACLRDGEVTDVPSLDQIEPAIRSSPPGRYHIDEISPDPLASGHTPRRWGVVINWRDGAVFLEHDPSPEPSRPNAPSIGSVPLLAPADGDGDVHAPIASTRSC